MKRLQFLASLALCAVTLAFSGCKTNLEPGGAYAPLQTNVVAGVTTVTSTADTVLFGIDSTFSFLYDTTEAVFKLERDNRALFRSISPAIKQTLDGIRPDAALAVVDFAKARKAYKANPTPAAADLLDTILARLKQVSAAAQAVVPTAAQIAAAKAS